jgi:hypothetical protein
MSFVIQPTTAVTVGTVSATATASIAKGKAVTLNSDGTLTQSGITGYAITTFTTSASAGVIGNNYNLSGINQILAYDPVNKKYIYIFPQPSTQYVMCCVGTLSGTTVTWGTPTILMSLYMLSANIIFTKDGKFVIFNNYDNANAAVVTVSGTTPTVGTITRIQTSSYTYAGGNATCYDSVNDRVYIAYQSFSSYTVNSYVGTISGTNISFGSEVQIPGVISGGDTVRLGCAFNPTTGKIAVQVGNVTSPATRILNATISGSTVSYGGSPLVFGGGPSFVSAVYVPQFQKILMTVSTGRISIIGTTGTDPTEDGFTGSGTTNFNTSFSSFTYDTTKNLIYLIGNTSASVTSTYQFKILQMTNATTINTNSTTTVNAIADSYPLGSQAGGIVFDATNSKVVIAIPSGASYLGQAYAQVGYGDTTNYTGFIGFSNSNYIAGQTATIETIGNTDANQSGLTPASKYYVQTDGTLSTIPAATSVYAGTAISATTILVKGQP